jgi:glutathione S-transferase
MKLVIGNKRLSSWSLRPWLLMKHFGISFEEILIPLDQPDTTANILKYSPTAKVPVLIDGDLHIWDSLAIAEYLHEKYPEKNLWPGNPSQRARARSFSAEMHSGFSDLRQHLSHDLQKIFKEFNWSPARADIERVKEIWTDCLKESGGPYLFGSFTIADSMYAPVANRFMSYAVPMEGLVKDYVDTIRNNSAHKLWIEAGLKETYSADKHP